MERVPVEGNASDAAVGAMRYPYDAAGESGFARLAEANAYRVQDPGGLTTIFAHERDFSRAGYWGLEVEIRTVRVQATNES